MLSQGRKRFTEKRSEKMWEVLLGYALEKVFGPQTTAFEVGGEYVQTTVSDYVPPQTVSKAPMGIADSNTASAVVTPSITKTKPGRHMIQVGFNPFTPIIIYGAEELYKRIAPVEQRDVYD